MQNIWNKTYTQLALHTLHILINQSVILFVVKSAVERNKSRQLLLACAYEREKCQSRKGLKYVQNMKVVGLIVSKK